MSTVGSYEVTVAVERIETEDGATWVYTGMRTADRSQECRTCGRGVRYYDQRLTVEEAVERGYLFDPDNTCGAAPQIRGSSSRCTRPAGHSLQPGELHHDGNSRAWWTPEG